MNNATQDHPDFDAIRLRHLLDDEQWPVLAGYLPPATDCGLDNLLGIYLWDQERRLLHYMPNPWCDVPPHLISEIDYIGTLLGFCPEAFEWDLLAGELYGVALWLSFDGPTVKRSPQPAS